MTISLLSCCLEEGNLNYPLGALCIQSALAQAFSKPDIVSRHHAYTLADDPLLAAQEVKRVNADVLGVSVYLWNRTWIEQFAVALKKEAP
ncbi:MAG: radical SAM protein, partial [Spirochaetia bacterium]|nr:radical SAM protein [Spirochaetia bacterium]